MAEPVDLPEFLSAAAPADLPTVKPPTAGFIVQLFLIPALIVGIIVMVYLLFGKIAGSQRDPDEFLKALRGANEEERWWAARELASILPHDKSWQNNEGLAEALSAELESNLNKGDTSRTQLQYEKYLAVALGEFNSPVGIPALRQALKPGGDDSLRAAAILSLGRLGDRLGALPDPDAIPDLLAAAQTDDPILRKLVAFTLGAVGRPEAIGGLESLLYDGDREVRYNAASSLARLGSTASLDTLDEMLDLERLRTLGLPEDQLEAVPLSALESLSQLLDRSPGADLKGLHSKIESLVRKGGIVVQISAEKLLIKMRGTGAN